MGDVPGVTTPLMHHLQARITSGGPLPFAEYMRLALYHADHGYYTTRVPGQGGDYGTSPSVTPWFGRLVARELQGMWERLGTPDPFTVIEVGAGRADLAAGAIEEASIGPMNGRLRWRIVEQFEQVEALQRARLDARLGPRAACVEWSRSLAPGPGRAPAAHGCVLAHEVIDNFPVHQVEILPGGGVGELFVDLEGGRLVERLRPPSDPALAEAGRQAAASLPPGRRVDVCLDLAGWCRDASAAIQQGFLLAVDYGDVEPDLWLHHPHGTVVTYGPTGFGEDPLADPGLRDVTAEVNFSALTRCLEPCGFAPECLVAQRDWLRSLGLDAVAAALEGAAERAGQAGDSRRALDLQGELSLLLMLVARLGLGDIMMFRAAKNLPAGTRR